MATVVNTEIRAARNSTASISHSRIARARRRGREDAPRRAEDAWAIGPRQLPERQCRFAAAWTGLLGDENRTAAIDAARRRRLIR